MIIEESGIHMVECRKYLFTAVEDGKMRRLIVALCVFCLTGLVQAGLLGTFDFEGAGTEVVAKNVAADVIISDLFIGYANSAGFTTETAIAGTPDVINDSSIIRIYGNESATGTSTAMAGQKYLSFTLSASAGKVLNLESMSVDVQGHEIWGYFNARLFSDIQGYDSVLGDTIGRFGAASTGSSSSGVSIDWVTYTQDLANPLNNAARGANVGENDFQGIFSVTFYLPFVQNSTSNTRWGEVDNIQISGTVVPEPTTLVLLGLGGLMARRRRK
jgi:hypothetical protein